MEFWKDIKKRFLWKTWWYWLPLHSMVIIFFIFYSKISNDLNADLISYFSVAQHYQDFNFTQAFNSYWSPLICWIMAFVPVLKKDPITVFRIINILIAFILYYQIFFWVRLVVLRSFSRFLLCLLISTLFAQLALSIGTPDFLSLLCFLVFLKLLVYYRFKYSQSLVLGFSILLCYFSKTFTLPLCLSIFGLYLVYRFFILKNKVNLKPVLLLFFVVCSGLFIWASCLKLHYGFYTLSSSAGVNNSIAPAQPVSLQTPPFEKSLFMWEDPYYLNRTSVYSGSGAFIINHLIHKFRYNFNITVYYFRYLSYLWIGILIFPIAGFFQKHDRRWKINLLLLATFFMNWFGYFLIFIMERYLIIGQVCLYISVFGCFEMLSKNIPGKYISITVQQFMLLFVFLCIIKNPIDEIRYGVRTFSQPQHEISQAQRLAGSGILKGKKIATFYDSKELYDYLSLACFQSDGKYYGEVWTGKPVSEQLTEIRQHQLDYIATYDCTLLKDNCVRKDWLSSYPLMYEDTLMKVKIYDIR